MTQADDRILEMLLDTGITLTPAVLAYNLDYSRQYVNTRARKLAAAGLIRNEGDGYYSITELGVSYLNGDADESDIPDLA